MLLKLVRFHLPGARLIECLIDLVEVRRLLLKLLLKHGLLLGLKRVVIFSLALFLSREQRGNMQFFLLKIVLGLSSRILGFPL